MKILTILFALLIFTTICFTLSACDVNSVTNSPTPEIVTVEVTRIEQINSTPQTVLVTHQVTRIVRVDRTVEVTSTPEPLLAKDCFDSAITQGEMNACAISEYQFALKELDEIFAQIVIPKEDMSELEKIQATWQIQMEVECNFFTSRTIEDEDGNLLYINGSMAPLERGLCMANRTKERIKELQFYFLQTSDL